MATIRVLWRQPDSMTLWGIPHAMREGQSPRDLWEGRRIPDTLAAARGWHGATMRVPGPREDWIYLGEPGWYGNRTAEQIGAIERFKLTIDRGTIPSGPCEWIDLGFNAAIDL